MHRRIAIMAVTAILTLHATAVLAHGPNQPPHQQYRIGDFKAKTLILAGQKGLLNPEWEPLEASRYIRDVRYVTIRPEAITGHASAGGLFPADVEFLNVEIASFLDIVTSHGARLR